MANDSQDILIFSTSDKVLLADAQSYFSMFVSNNELNIVFSDILNKKSVSDGRAFRKSNKSKFKYFLTSKYMEAHRVQKKCKEIEEEQFQKW